MFEVGRLAIKIAGRDAGLKCVIVDVIDDNYVLIDGLTRRRKCNMKHLEPLKEAIKIEKNTSHNVIIDEFKKLGIELREKKQKQKTERQKKTRGKKETPAEELKKAKKTPKAAKQKKKEAKAEKTIEEKVGEDKEVNE